MVRATIYEYLGKALSVITWAYKNTKVGLFSAILQVRLREAEWLAWNTRVCSSGSQIPVYMDVQVVCFPHHQAAAGNVHPTGDAVPVKGRDGSVRKY